MTSGLDTLVSQSYGAGNHAQSGWYLQRAIFISTVACIPLTIFLRSVTPVLILLGQDPMVSALAGDLVRGTLLSLWAMFAQGALIAYMRAQQLPNVQLYVSLVSTLVHLGSCYVFIARLRMGNYGAGLALSATNWMAFFMLLGYVQVVRPGVTQQSWVKPSLAKATSNLRSFLSVSLPSAFAMWAEWWCAELMTLLAGIIGPTALAAHAALISTFGILYSVGGGVQAAASTLVGNAVGAERAGEARCSALTALLVMLVELLALNALMLPSQPKLAALLAGTDEVRAQMLSAFPVMLLMCSLDSLQTVVDGILRGLGKQALMFKVKMATMWMIRMPSAVVSVFLISSGLRGLWWSSTCGMAASLTTYLFLLRRMDWHEEVRVASCSRQQRESMEFAPGLGS